MYNSFVRINLTTLINVVTINSIQHNEELEITMPEKSKLNSNKCHNKFDKINLIKVSKCHVKNSII